MEREGWYDDDIKMHIKKMIIIYDNDEEQTIINIIEIYLDHINLLFQPYLICDDISSTRNDIT